MYYPEDLDWPLRAQREIARTPGGQFNMKRVQRANNAVTLFVGNHDWAARSNIICGLGAPRQTEPTPGPGFRIAEHQVPIMDLGSDGNRCI